MPKTVVDLNINIYTPTSPLTPKAQDAVASFLFKALEQYGDPKSDIYKAIDYAMSKNNKPGGYVVEMKDQDQIIGAVVVNQTGMEDYIPENILVYIAADPEYRGQGLGKQLMKTAIDQAEGAIALHVEPDNPAKFLYEKLGFTNKYLEMRLTK
jgi:ribosomal-protein-alanine N-acetyltransferase